MAVTTESEVAELFRAIWEDNAHHVRMMLDAHPELVNARDGLGTSALYAAVKYGFSDLDMLLDAGGRRCTWPPSRATPRRPRP